MLLRSHRSYGQGRRWRLVRAMPTAGRRQDVGGNGDEKEETGVSAASCAPQPAVVPIHVSCPARENAGARESPGWPSRAAAKLRCTRTSGWQGHNASAFPSVLAATHVPNPANRSRGKYWKGLFTPWGSRPAERQDGVRRPRLSVGDMESGDMAAASASAGLRAPGAAPPRASRSLLASGPPAPGAEPPTAGDRLRPFEEPA